mmetsp:Transcript_4455/g.10685  ORF Transcript_4455/g.10685 Transcript_4455/m.10685 type:complete len:201 (-) Transcript_4455:860-1462(-)
MKSALDWSFLAPRPPRFSGLAFLAGFSAGFSLQRSQASVISSCVMGRPTAPIFFPIFPNSPLKYFSILALLLVLLRTYATSSSTPPVFSSFLFFRSSSLELLELLELLLLLAFLPFAPAASLPWPLSAHACWHLCSAPSTSLLVHTRPRILPSPSCTLCRSHTKNFFAESMEVHLRNMCSAKNSSVLCRCGSSSAGFSTT